MVKFVHDREEEGSDVKGKKKKQKQKLNSISPFKVSLGSNQK